MADSRAAILTEVVGFHPQVHTRHHGHHRQEGRQGRAYRHGADITLPGWAPVLLSPAPAPRLPCLLLHQHCVGRLSRLRLPPSSTSNNLERKRMIPAKFVPIAAQLVGGVGAGAGAQGWISAENRRPGPSSAFFLPSQLRGKNAPQSADWGDKVKIQKETHPRCPSRPLRGWGPPLKRVPRGVRGRAAEALRGAAADPCHRAPDLLRPFPLFHSFGVFISVSHLNSVPGKKVDTDRESAVQKGWPRGKSRERKEIPKEKTRVARPEPRPPEVSPQPRRVRAFKYLWDARV